MDLLREASGILMMVFFILCYIPQIIKIYRNKSSKDVSLMLILMSIGGYICGMVYMFLTTFGIWWFLNYLAGLTSCIVLTVAWFKYRKNSDKDNCWNS